MIFDLAVYRHFDDSPELITFVHAADVVWSTDGEDRLRGIATKDGVRIRELCPFDDFPIQIKDDRIEIEGYCYVDGKDSYETWILTASL